MFLKLCAALHAKLGCCVLCCITEAVPVFVADCWGFLAMSCAVYPTLSKKLVHCAAKMS